MENIFRRKYVDKVASFLDKGLIIALTGQRRVGKSYIMRQVADVLDSGANVIYIDKEQNSFSGIHNHQDLYDYVTNRLVEGSKNYLLIDEVQEIEEFEYALRSLNSAEQCQIIVTGSNARMLSSDLSTYLSGRYIEVHIQSLSYNEFLLFHHLENTEDSLFLYLRYGGLPFLRRIGLANTDIVWEYIHNIYNTIALKDVVQRGKIRNVPLFENLMEFIGDNVGQLVSASSLSKYLKSQRVELSPMMAVNYLRSACDAFLTNKVSRYDIHGKRLLESNEKYYFEDLGIRNSLKTSQNIQDIEKLMENAVYLHLKSSGYKINVGTLTGGEVDFVAFKNGKPVYIQVAYQIHSEETAKREFGNLTRIPDSYPKYVITLDRVFVDNENGIPIIQLRDFLSSEF